MTHFSRPDIPLAPLEGLQPVISSDIHTIILGSFPGRDSLAARQYYAHPRNQFWRLMSVILNVDLLKRPYNERLPVLLSHGIGLWDVISMCEREGSLDSRIKHPVANDFDRLKNDCPELKRICFNGKVAGSYAERLAFAGFDTIVLPSSSSAYASRSFEEKLTDWRDKLTRRI